MKNKNIKDVFTLLSPSEDQVNDLYERIDQQKNVKSHSYIYKIGAAAACLLLVVIASFTIMNGQGSSSNQPDSPKKPENRVDIRPKVQATNQVAQATDQTANKEKAVFDGFVVTTYITKESKVYLSANYKEESEASILNPELKLLLPEYSPLISAVPGIPFTVDLKDSKSNSYEIKVSVDTGKLLTWEIPSGKVSGKGTLTTCKTGETLYWSPLASDEENSSLADKATIKIAAYDGEKEIASQKIIITMKDDNYYAQMGELELAN